MAWKRLAFLFLLPFLLQLPCLAKEYAPISGKVTGITDGDTLSVLVELPEGKGKKEIKVRLYGIDSPEDGQDFGRKAKEYASSLAYGRTVTLQPKDKDKYGRIVADVILPEGENLNHEIVKAGFGWWYVEYAKDDKELSRLQEEAKAAKIGLWSHANPVPPWDYRKGEPKEGTDSLLQPLIGTSSNPSEVQSTQVFITKSGTKFHSEGCRHLGKSKIPISLEEAQAKGLQPCSVCNPSSSKSPAQSPSGNRPRWAIDPNQNAIPKTAIVPVPLKSTALPDSQEQTVYVTKSGTKYHSSGCRHLSKSKIPIPLSQAKGKYGPCSNCSPPQ